MTSGPTIRLLGRTSVVLDGTPVALPPGKTTALFAVLALNAGAPVEAGVLVDELWAEDPPDSARSLVHTYVSTLRRALAAAGHGAPRVLTVPGGYLLEIEPDDVDLLSFIRQRADDLTDEELESALAASTGPVLQDSSFASRESWRLQVEAQRAAVQDLLWARRVDSGDAGQVIPELRVAVREQPLREDRVLMFARALGSVGRRDEALSVLDDHRLRLSEELGLNPSPLIAEEQQRLIVGPHGASRRSPSTPAPAGSSRATHPDRAADPSRDQRHRRGAAGRVLVATLVLVVGGVIAAVGLDRDPDRDRDTDVRGASLLMVDPASGELLDVLDLPVEPSRIDAVGRTVLVTSELDRAAAVVDLSGAPIVDVVGLPQPPTSLAVTDRSAVLGLGFTGETVTVLDGRVSPPRPAFPGSQGRLTLAGDEDQVWVASIDGVVKSLEPPEPRQGPRRVHGAPLRMAVDGDRIWVLTFDRRELVSLGGVGAEPVVSLLRGEPVDVTATSGDAWAVTSGDDRLWRASAGVRRVVTTRVLPGPPSAVSFAVGADRVWVAVQQPPSLMAFDRVTLEPITSVDLPREPVDLALTIDALVVAVR